MYNFHLKRSKTFIFMSKILEKFSRNGRSGNLMRNNRQKSALREFLISVSISLKSYIWLLSLLINRSISWLIHNSRKAKENNDCILRWCRVAAQTMAITGAGLRRKHSLSKLAKWFEQFGWNWNKE